MPVVTCGSSEFNCYVDNQYVRFKISVFQVGGELFAEFEKADAYSSARQIEKPALVRLRFGGTEDLTVRLDQELKKTGEALADILKNSLGFRKDENGMWVPNAAPGDTILIDKASRPSEIQVVSQQQGQTIVEHLEKKKLTVDEVQCVCPARDLFNYGCRCRAKAA